MEYVLEILKYNLRQEIIALESAKQLTSGNGFVMKNTTAQAFEESRKLAEERIPQLQLAIKLLTEFKS